MGLQKHKGDATAIPATDKAGRVTGRYTAKGYQDYRYDVNGRLAKKLSIHAVSSQNGAIYGTHKIN